MDLLYIFRIIKILGIITLMLGVISACNPFLVPTNTKTPIVAPEIIDNPVTNLKHLNFMMTNVSLYEDSKHTTFDIDKNGKTAAIWVKSIVNEDGTYTLYGEGVCEANKWNQAYRLDDIAKASIVKIRHWLLFKDYESYKDAYNLLRTAMYMQNMGGPKTGLSVRWMNSDGTLNNLNNKKDINFLSSKSIHPSDADISEWFSLYLWALGEGYSAFKDKDPDFALYIKNRIKLSESVISKSLMKSSKHEVLHGEKISQNLVTENTQINSNIVLGLSAYLRSENTDASTEKILKTITDGLATTPRGNQDTWPFGAIMSSTHSNNFWSSSNSGAGSALAAAAPVLKRSDVMNPAILDSSLWNIYLLTGGGISDIISASFQDDAQSTVGIDLRLRSIIDVGKKSEADGLIEISSMIAGWYFGANKASKPMFNKDGVFYTKIKNDNSIDINSTAEANISGNLSMLALDSNPNIKKSAKSLTRSPQFKGVQFYDIDSFKFKNNHKFTHNSMFTEDGLKVDHNFVHLNDKDSFTFNIEKSALPCKIFPIIEKTLNGKGSTEWFTAEKFLGSTNNSLKNDNNFLSYRDKIVVLSLNSFISSENSNTVRAQVVNDGMKLHGVIVQPQITKVDFMINEKHKTLFYNSGKEVVHYPVSNSDLKNNELNVKIYDSKGRYISREQISSNEISKITIAPSGFSIIN